ncbi:MAG: response regulator [Planctomycetota bacterium]
MHCSHTLTADLPAGSAAERAAFGSTDGMWEWRKGGAEAWFSASCASLLGVSERDHLGCFADWTALIHPADVDAVVTAVEACAETGVPVDHAYRIRCRTGDYRWYRMRGARHHVKCEGAGENAEEVVVSGGMHDIHAHRVAAQAAREREQRMMQRQRMQAVDCLASGIAHEFNNVLQAMGGYVSFARDELSPDSQPYADLTAALSAADRAATLTRSLLDFARAEEGAQTACDINRVVNGLYELMGPILGEDMQFCLQTSAKPLVTKANVTELRQSLLNLCVNARDAMPSGGSLNISVEPFRISELHVDTIGGLKPGLYCRISVVDTGCGLMPELSEQIFDPFFTTKDSGVGAGLGLATVHGFVQRSNGFVSVFSEGPDTGAALSMYLPVEETIVTNELEPSAETEQHRQTILLAEDDASVREIARRMLENAGYRVLCEADGEAALETYIENAEDISLVLLDAVLPRLTGRMVFEQIRRFHADVPIVFYTGYGADSVQGEMLGQSVNAVLSKPFDEEQLLRTIGGLLAKENTSECCESTIG